MRKRAADNLGRDLDAVENAVTERWSSGQGEGQRGSIAS